VRVEGTTSSTSTSRRGVPRRDRSPAAPVLRLDHRDAGDDGVESDGIFGNDDHTLSEGRLAGAPFAVTLEPSGDFLIPPGTGNFIVSGKVESGCHDPYQPVARGTYDEDAGLFTLTGLVDVRAACR
jgi:hypothetical protein